MSLREKIAKEMFDIARESNGLGEMDNIPNNHAYYWDRCAGLILSLIVEDLRERADRYSIFSHDGSVVKHVLNELANEYELKEVNA